MIVHVTCPIEKVKELILKEFPEYYSQNSVTKMKMVRDMVKPIHAFLIYDYMEIKEITDEEAKKIIDIRTPRGKFWCKENKVYIGIDNETGDAWTEEFKDKDSCVEWLMGEDGE